MYGAGIGGLVSLIGGFRSVLARSGINNWVYFGVVCGDKGVIDRVQCVSDAVR